MQHIKAGTMVRLKVLSCDGCGVCCNHMGSPPFMPDEFAALPAALKAEVDAYLVGPLHRADEAPCLWLDRSTGRCRNYEHRPGVCRDFRRGSASCRYQRKEAGLPA